jgi:hypothetical protein
LQQDVVGDLVVRVIQETLGDGLRPSLGSGPSPNLMGLYCFVNMIFRDTSASLQFVVLLKRQMEMNTSASHSDAMFKRLPGDLPF